MIVLMRPGERGNEPQRRIFLGIRKKFRVGRFPEVDGRIAVEKILLSNQRNQPLARIVHPPFTSIALSSTGGCEQHEAG